MSRWSSIIFVSTAILPIAAGFRQPFPPLTQSSVPRAQEVEIALDADCVVIEDPDKNDNGCGALSCAREVFAQSKPGPNDTKTATTLLAGCLHTGGTAMIIGHGQSGRIDTGGEPTPQLSQFIGYQDKSEKNWQGDIDRLKPEQISLFTLFGCSTGFSGQLGARGQGIQLLNKVASHSQATTVRAPTGDVACHDKKFYFEDDASWQDGPVPPNMVGPQPQPRPSTKMNNFFEFRYVGPTSEEIRKVFLKDIRKITVSWTRTEQAVPLAPETWQRFLNISNAEAPEARSGCPVARTIGYATVFFNLDGIAQSRTLEVLGDGLLRDTSQHDVNIFYRGSLEFLPAWEDLLLVSGHLK